MPGGPGRHPRLDPFRVDSAFGQPCLGRTDQVFDVVSHDCSLKSAEGPAVFDATWPTLE